ncbi:hypothetical protein F4821DRAFT_143470 [Hypoxylon rubiginosum]|uniref:Uncharacterized protein n=1 Tax=Hypoxylon rubiginosum TaxID=110542 RepID=A0ACC0D0J1_9PEZI|nr:hypothetical protein F4821DRAFT_143470 [Hypoxylon rubiginosum]
MYLRTLLMAALAFVSVYALPTAGMKLHTFYECQLAYPLQTRRLSKTGQTPLRPIDPFQRAPQMRRSCFNI